MSDACLVESAASIARRKRASERQEASIPGRVAARRLPGAGRARPRVLEGAADLREEPRGPRRRAGVRVLRRASDGQRQARLAPCGLAHLQGPLPALQDHARLPRAAQGRLGHPRPAGRARGRAPPRHRRQAAIEEYGVAEFNRLCRRASPRISRSGSASPSASASGSTSATRTTRSPTGTSRRCGGCCARSGTRACCIRGTRSCRTARVAARRSAATRSRRATRTSPRIRSTCASRCAPRPPRSSACRPASRMAGRTALRPLRVSLAVWTTTPWTLVSNVAAAVHPEVTYALVESRGARFVLARELRPQGARQAGHRRA